MFATLHGAFGTWPSDSSHRTTEDPGIVGGSGLNERLDFGEEAEVIPPASSVFVTKFTHYPIGKVFVPPHFVPPGRRAVRSLSEAARDLSLTNGNDVPTSLDGLSHYDSGPPEPSINHEAPSKSATRPVELQFDYSPPSLLSPQYTVSQNEVRQSASPPSHKLDIQRGREANWSDSARQAFHTMIYAPNYVNRYRLGPDKASRLIAHLRSPERELLLADGSRDHQTRYQAAHWLLRDGKLYKKAGTRGESGVRRHLDLEETWAVLTAEHLRSGHLGRDRLRKILERNYIGYTLQEIMFVLRECKRCNGSIEKDVESTQVESTERQPEPMEPIEMDTPTRNLARSSFVVKNSSNFMMY